MVNQNSTNSRNKPRVALDAAGDVLVSWDDYRTGQPSRHLGPPLRRPERRLGSGAQDQPEHARLSAGERPHPLPGAGRRGGLLGSHGRQAPGPQARCRRRAPGRSHPDRLTRQRGPHRPGRRRRAGRDGAPPSGRGRTCSSTPASSTAPGMPSEATSCRARETLDSEWDPVVAAGGQGSFAVAWNSAGPLILSPIPEPIPQDQDGRDGSSFGVFAQRLQSSSLCAAGSEVLCLDGGRFQARVSWKNPYTGETGTGKTLPLTGDTGSFWFFSPATSS